MKPGFVLSSFISLFILSFVLSANAQVLPASIETIDLNLSVDNPVPGQTVAIHAESHATDLNSSTITWTLNGNLFQKGVGLTDIQIEAPLLGKQLKIGVSAVSADSKQFSNSITLGSGSVDIILETDGYVPPFFESKIPLVYQNTYRLIAMPHLADSSGKIYDPKNLVYQWTKDSKVIQDQSGYGKQVFSWKDEVVPRQRSVNVKVSTRDGSAQAEKTITFQAGSPSISFYRDDPLYGPLYNSALDTQVNLGKSGELSVLAIPYGFNKPSNGAGSLSFSWLVNSLKQIALESSQSIILRAPGDAGGSSDISLQIKNNNEILQGAQSSFNVSFNKLSNSSSETNAPNYNGI
jgi:hypothetical protein